MILMKGDDIEVEELVLKAKQGNAEAYTKLMLEIRNDLYKICKTRITNDDEIDDIVQETMIQTFKHLKTLKDTSKFKSWIITILLNNCNNLYRKKHKVKLVNIEEGDSKRLISNNIENIEEDMDFYQLLSDLKYEERIIIVLYYSEKFTLKEISKILHTNENTIKTRLYRAKEKIKEKCKGGMVIG